MLEESGMYVWLFAFLTSYQEVLMSHLETYCFGQSYIIPKISKQGNFSDTFRVNYAKSTSNIMEKEKVLVAQLKEDCQLLVFRSMFEMQTRSQTTAQPTDGC